MDRLENLDAFVAVVETGSFTAAAERLNLAKSVVSRRVTALERQLAAQLLRRTTRRLHVTDTGRGFYERCVRILADLDEAEAAVAQAHGELRGRLNLALPVSFGARHMSGPIARFARRHPLVEFDLNFNDRRVDLLEEGVDVALRIGSLADSSLIARKLFDARTIVCGSPDYLARAGTPSVLEDLNRHHCVVYGILSDPHRWVCWDSDGKRQEIEVKSALTANSGEFLCQAAVAGLGLVIQPTFIASNAIRQGELVPVLTRYRWPVSPAHAVYPPTRHLSHRVRAFIDFLVQEFAGTPYWDRDCEARPH